MPLRSSGFLPGALFLFDVFCHNGRMNADIQTVLNYHERTKHRPWRYAASPGYLDWATQPDPYRTYDGAKHIALPLPAETGGSAYARLFEGGEAPSALTKASVSQLLRFSMGLAAIKTDGHSQWALRCNASSGNLHPTEAYVLLPPMQEVSETANLYHYLPKTHTLERLQPCDASVFEGLPKGAFFVVLASIAWREAWKYGERAFRYVHLDAGHALRSMTVAAKMQGWHCRIVDACTSRLDAALGFDTYAYADALEHEHADMLMLVTPEICEIETVALPPLSGATAFPNRLSPAHRPWPVIEAVEQATSGAPTCSRVRAEEAGCTRGGNRNAAAVILGRRSARQMDPERSPMPRETFMQLLCSVRGSCDGFEPTAELILFVHRVEGLRSGLYLYNRNADQNDALRSVLDGRFGFETVGSGLYALEYGDFRAYAKAFSCAQDIASDGAFMAAMLVPTGRELRHCGAARYKSLYHECGAVGQQLYLEATSLGYDATGIGCFLDDEVHRFLGIENGSWQVLYHFTVGRAVPDTRVQTLQPYSAVCRVDEGG